MISSLGKAVQSDYAGAGWTELSVQQQLLESDAP